MKGNSKGFTLIELVIVIVILGILAAVAVPKFANLQTDAKKSAVKGLGGAVKAAADITRAKWLVKDNGTASTVTIDAETIDVYTASDNLSGYPKPTASGIGNALDYDTDKYKTSESSPNFEFSYTGNTAANCGVIYKADEPNDNLTVTINTDGC